MFFTERWQTQKRFYNYETQQNLIGLHYHSLLIETQHSLQPQPQRNRKKALKHEPKNITYLHQTSYPDDTHASRIIEVTVTANGI